MKIERSNRGADGPLPIFLWLPFMIVFFYFSMKSTIRNRRRVTYVISLRSENGSGRTFFFPKKKAPKKLINIFFFSIKKNYE